MPAASVKPIPSSVKRRPHSAGAAVADPKTVFCLQHYAHAEAVGEARTHVVGAFDINDLANRVYRANFPSTTVHQVRRRAHRARFTSLRIVSLTGIARCLWPVNCMLPLAQHRGAPGRVL